MIEKIPGLEVSQWKFFAVEKLSRLGNENFLRLRTFLGLAYENVLGMEKFLGLENFWVCWYNFFGDGKFLSFANKNASDLENLLEKFS